MPRVALSSIAPFFIVRELTPAIAYYVPLGFEVVYSAPDPEPFFAIIARDEVQIFLKAIAPEIEPQPNPTRHDWAPWDAFVHVENPDELAAEFAEVGVVFHKELADSEQGLRGFSLRDNDGYVLYFGRPR